MSDKNCPECHGWGGTYTTDRMGQPMGIECTICGIDCETFRVRYDVDGPPCDYQIVANAAAVGKEKK